MFGYWGGGVNIVDGRYTWFCYPKDMKNQDLYQYTLMPTHMTKMFSVDELKSASLVGPFDFTNGVPLLRIAQKAKVNAKMHSYMFPEEMMDANTVLYDLQTDPGQATPIDDPPVRERLKGALFRLMAENDAPPEAPKRMKESLGEVEQLPGVRILGALPRVVGPESRSITTVKVGTQLASTPLNIGMPPIQPGSRSIGWIRIINT